MSRFLPIALIVLFLTACSNPVVDNTGDRPETSMLSIYVYTIDSLTPSGSVTLISENTNTGQSDSIVMESANSSISGISLWTAKISLGSLGSDTLNLHFENSNGDLAQGMLKKDNPWWRIVDEDANDPYEVLNESLGLYEYRELIRHWETDTNGNTVTFTGDVLDDNSSPLTDYDIEIIPFHGVSSRSSFGYWTETIEDISTSSYSVAVNNIQTISSEASLPFEDFLDISVVKDFYSDSRDSVDYIDLHGKTAYANEDQVLIANRKISFKWIQSDTGFFSVGDTPESSIVNTVRRWDFQDSGLASYYYDNFSDTMLDDDLNRYYFDTNHTMGMAIDAYYYGTETIISLYSFGGVAEIIDLEGSVATLPANLNLNDPALSGDNWFTLDAAPGQIFGIRTDYGYALVEITAIDIMETTEMDTIKSDYAAYIASQPSPSLIYPMMRSSGTTIIKSEQRRK